MKLNRDILNMLPLDDAVTVALLIADATQNVRSKEARAAGMMMALQVYLDEMGEDPQDIATVVQNMRAKATGKPKSQIAALAEYVAEEMINTRTADDILGTPEF